MEHLTTKQAAASLDVSYAKLMGWIYSGAISARKHGWCWFISPEEVERIRRERAA